MTEIIISIAAKLVEYLVDPAIRQSRYLFCPKKIIKNLEKVKEELVSVRDHVQKDVKGEREKTHEIDDVVQKWLDKVTSIMEETKNLEQKMQANITCFQGWHPNFRRYRLCKQMAKATTMMLELSKDKINVKEFTSLRTIPGIEYQSSENFIYFGSTIAAYNQLFEALKDDSIYMIGLHGMGGSGKTTLVTEVGKKAKESGLFDRVLSVTVSQNPNIRSIQGEMADMLKLELKEESVNGRAQRLWLRLQEEKQVLIILDDVWGRLNLEDIGIWLDDNNKGACKVLLTTRVLPVCKLMCCQKNIPLHLFSEEDAWTLFQMRAGLADEPSSNLLQVVARKIASECKGLPIAIEAVGSSLKGRPIEEWRAALDNLSRSKPIDVEEGVRDAFSCLELSYNHLKSKEVKLLFLICSMFPEDHEIYIEDLIRYGVGLGVYGEYQSFELARSQVRTGINKLVDYCLLAHSEKEKGHLKMHDMVRDVALWIARKEHRTIMVNLEKDLNALVENGAMKDCFIVSSWHEETDRISHQMEAPKLEILLLSTIKSLDLSHASFEDMKMIKVMSVVQEDYYKRPLSFPQSTQLFSNLRTLRLSGWTLPDISFIVSLTRLEVLDLRRCFFYELPDGIEKLNKLRLLDLSYCESMNFNCEAVGRCSQLEELYAFGYDRNDCFQLNYPFQDDLMEILTLPNLQRYAIKVEAFSKDYDYGKNIKVIHLFKFDISTLSASKWNLLQRADNVHLYNLQGGCKSITPDMVKAVGGIYDLTKLSLKYCCEIECLIDTTSDPVSASSFPEDAPLPSLVELKLVKMLNLKELCRGEPLPVFFEKLEALYIWKCPQLCSIFPRTCNLRNLKILKIGSLRNGSYDFECRNVTAVEELFSMSVAKSLQRLEELTVQGCSKLKHIITNGRENGTKTGEEIVPALDNAHLTFPNLKKLFVSHCPKIKFIFPISSVHEGLGQLQEIVIVHCDELKFVFGHYDQDSHSSHQIEIMLPVLRVFRLNHLGSLLGICPENNHSSFPSVRELSWSGCPKLNTSCTGVMIDLGQRQLHLNREVAIVKDQQKHLTSLSEPWSSPTPTLRQIWNFQYLKSLELFSCGKLKRAFPMVIYGSLPELTFISIDDCEELEEIIAEDEESLILSNPAVCFPKLTNLEVRKCNKLKSLFSAFMVKMLPQLSILHISEAAQLEEVFRYKMQDGIVNVEELVLQNLREIELRNLHSLTDICQGLTLKAVDVTIFDCPKLVPILEATEMVPLHSIPKERGGVMLMNITATSSQLSAEVLPEALQSFLELETLSLQQCAVEGIFQLHVESGLSCNTEQKPFNSNLNYLRLDSLPELRFIWNVPIDFLSLLELKEVYLKGCPKLEVIFSSTVARCLPKLKRLEISSCEELQVIVSSNSEDAEQHRSPSAACPRQLLCFQQLECVSLSECPKLKVIFSSSVARCLPKLRQLTIRNCDLLEEIMCSNSEDAQDFIHPSACPRQKVLFPDLRIIEVEQCNKIKHLFLDSMACHIPKVERLVLEECPQLERVFKIEGEEDGDQSHGREDPDEERERIVFPELSYLRLKNLPIFIEIHRGYKLKMSWVDCEVEECPNIILNNKGECSRYNFSTSSSSEDLSRAQDIIFRLPLVHRTCSEASSSGDN